MGHKNDVIHLPQYLKYRLRVVSNFGDGDCGAGEIHTRARNFEETRRDAKGAPKILINTKFF